jgi:MoxR-like ATPase
MTLPVDWHIYRGSGETHDGIDSLPAPPPWRTFNGTVLEQHVPDEASSQVSPSRVAARAAAYLPDEDAVDMVNVALFLRRPLLVGGKPGIGKSTLASSIAHELKLGPLLHWPVGSRSTLADALYRYDALGRFQQAQLQTRGAEPPEIGQFIRLGPLGTALLARDRPRALLIDELDKSDIDLPNDLLNVFEEGWFEIPELARMGPDHRTRVMTADGGWATVENGIVRCNAFPVIVITSNGEREFPQPFLRRCLRVTLEPPSAKKLARIVESQLGDAAVIGATDIIDQFVRTRETADLATDQLLNAIRFVTSGIELEPEKRREMTQRIFHSLGPGSG